MAKESVLSVVRSRRVRLREEDVRSHLQGCLDSGQTLPEYCKQHSLPYKRLLWWRRQLEDRDATARRGGAFVEVEVKRSASRTLGRPTPHAAKERKGSITVRLRNG